MDFMRHNVLSIRALPELFDFNEINYILLCAESQNIHTDLPVLKSWKSS